MNRIAIANGYSIGCKKAQKLQKKIAAFPPFNMDAFLRLIRDVP